jgi:hypothetical protein
VAIVMLSVGIALWLSCGAVDYAIRGRRQRIREFERRREHELKSWNEPFGMS